MTGRVLAVAATILCGCDRLPIQRQPDPFAWAPGYSQTVVRGKEAGHRFGLLTLHEVTVEIDNVFAAPNREALEIAEQKLTEVPGVRAVHGPARLLDISVDGSGKTSARRVLRASARDERGEETAGARAAAPGPGAENASPRPPEDPASPARRDSSWEDWDPPGAPGLVEGEAARQRVVRRADALGWFLTANGRRARFLVDAEDWRRVAPGVGAALAGSGLALAPSGGEPFEARPLWPDPRDRGRWLPLGIAAAWTFFVLVGLGLARLRAADRSRRRRRARVLAVAAGAAAPFLLVPVWGIRALGGLAALESEGGAPGAWPRAGAFARRGGDRGRRGGAVSSAPGRNATVERGSVVLRQRAGRLRRPGRAEGGAAPHRFSARAAGGRERMVGRGPVRGHHARG